MLAHPNQCYLALLGGSSFSDEQFAADGENRHFECDMHWKQVHLRPIDYWKCPLQIHTFGGQYFRNTRSVTYLVSPGAQYLTFECRKDKLPFTDHHALLRFSRQDFFNISPMETCVHTPAWNFKSDI